MGITRSVVGSSTSCFRRAYSAPFQRNMRVLVVLFAVLAVSYGAFITADEDNQNLDRALESSIDDAENKERLIFQTVKKTTTTTSYSTTTVTTFTLCAITIVQGSGCIPYGRKRKRSAAIAQSPVAEIAPVESVINTAPEVAHERVERDASPASDAPEKGRFFLVTSSTTTTLTTTVTTTSYSATVSATISSCSANIIPPYNACAVGK